MNYPYPQKKKKLYFVMVLDNSSSMNAIKDEARDAFNRQIETLAKTADALDCRVGLVTFDSKVNEPTVWDAPVTSLKPLGPDDYRPSGWTALLDGLGKTIDRLKKFPDINDPHVNVLVVTISDGAENYSREYKQDGVVAAMVRRAEATGRWTFVYEGAADLDLEAISKKLGVQAVNSSSFVADSVGMASATMRRAMATENYTKCLVDDQQQFKGFYGDASSGNVDIGDVKVTSTSENETP